LRLQKHLAEEENATLFKTSGELSQSAIENSARLPLKIANAQLRQLLSDRPGNLIDWGKYETAPTHTNAGFVRMHFYHNPVTNDVYYGMDYKAIFDHQGVWNLEPSPKFDYESSQFNLNN